MKKLGTTLLLALSLMSFTACGKKDKNSVSNNYCGPQYGYAQGQCGAYAYNQQYNQYGQPVYGQQYGQQYGQMCQAGMVQTVYGCLQQGPCATYGNYGYHPTINNGAPGCVAGSQQMYGQQYGGGYYGQTGW